MCYNTLLADLVFIKRFIIILGKNISIKLSDMLLDDEMNYENFKLINLNHWVN